MEACIFCKIVQGEIPCFKVYEDDNVLAFEDINPLAEGHTLVIPKKHAENIWVLPEEDLAAVHMASKRVAQAIRDALGSSGIIALQLNGRAVNQVVMHYHLHLIPRASDGPPLPVASWEPSPGDMDAVKETAEKISSAMR